VVANVQGRLHRTLRRFAQQHVTAADFGGANSAILQQIAPGVDIAFLAARAPRG
jgi:hypothetical protein